MRTFSTCKQRFDDFLIAFICQSWIPWYTWEQDHARQLKFAYIKGKNYER